MQKILSDVPTADREKTYNYFGQCGLKKRSCSSQVTVSKLSILFSSLRSFDFFYSCSSSGAVWICVLSSTSGILPMQPAVGHISTAFGMFIDDFLLSSFAIQLSKLCRSQYVYSFVLLAEPGIRAAHETASTQSIADAAYAGSCGCCYRGARLVPSSLWICASSVF